MLFFKVQWLRFTSVSGAPLTVTLGVFERGNILGTEELFIQCKKCGKRISKEIKVCPHCGEKQKKITIIQWIGICFITLFVIGLINTPDNDVSSSTNSVKANSYSDNTASEASRSEEGMKKVKLDFEWAKTGFGNIMEATFIITNNNSFQIKDIEIECQHYAKSGTTIDSNKGAIFDVVPANSKKVFANFNMGFVHTQAVSTSCYITKIKV